MERLFQVVPDADGIAAVRHDLGTENVQVRCLRADGTPVGYRCHAVITRDEIEVSTVPGSGVATVEVRPVSDSA